MRIGIEAQRILRPKKHGMDVVALELIRNLQELDHKNEYIVFARSDTDDSAILETANFKMEKFSSLSYADWEQIKLRKAVISSKLDLLHCTANTAPLSVPSRLMVTIHDIIYLEKIDFGGNAYQNLGNLYRRYVVPKIAKKADLIITVSEFERNNILEKLKLPADKVKVVYNGVSPNFNHDYTFDQINEFRTRYGLPERYIMFLGNTAPKKNTSNVIRAYVEYCLSERDPAPMVLLDYKKELVAAMLTDLKQPGLIDRFLFPGYLPYYQIPLMYAAATIFLYPSLRESFGLPILESMACGTPVITSTTSSMPEIAGDAAKQIDPYDPLQLAGAIKSLMQDEVLRQQYITKGLERVKQFTWRDSAKRLLALYETFQ